MYKILLLATAVVLCTGFPSFRNRIPNGYTIPSPCPSINVYWEAVGHYNDSMGGETNPFGDDFASAGYRWTPSLCRLDSDLDGIPNGEELGDPFCEWTISGAEHIGNATGHPGICEPFNSPACRGQVHIC